MKNSEKEKPEDVPISKLLDEKLQAALSNETRKLLDSIFEANSSSKESFLEGFRLGVMFTMDLLHKK